MSDEPDTDGAPDCVFDTTLAVSPDCSNSWNLAPKSFVMEKLDFHADAVGTHERLFGELDDGLSAFTYENGRGTMLGLSDRYGNRLHPDGAVDGRFGGFTCETTEPGFDYDAYMAGMQTSIEGLRARAENKVDRYTFAGALSFHDGVIDKVDTVYTLKQATPGEKGGIRVATAEIEDSDETTPSGDAIYRAVRELSGKLSGVRPSRIGFRPKRTTVHALPDDEGRIFPTDNTVVVVEPAGNIHVAVPSKIVHGFQLVVNVPKTLDGQPTLSIHAEDGKAGILASGFNIPYDMSDDAGRALLFDVKPGAYNLVLVELLKFSAPSLP